MKHPRVLLLVFICHLFSPAVATAAINPALFKKGPEQLVIKVIGRSVQTYAKVESVQLLAEVVSVERSATKLRPGDTILISYERYPETLAQRIAERRKRPPMPGPQLLYEPRPPKLNDVVKAYLRHHGAKHGRVYRPTAHQYSFERR